MWMLLLFKLTWIELKRINVKLAFKIELQWLSFWKIAPLQYFP